MRQTVPLLLAAALALPACSSPTAAEARVHRLLLEARYQEALDLAATRYEADPDDPQRAEDYRNAAVAVLLDAARTANFEDEYGQAFEFLLQAEALDPVNPHVVAWLAKTRTSLARESLDLAREAEAAGELDVAYERYLEASVLVPDDLSAIVGASRVLLRRNYRAGLGDVYYRDGVRALRDLRVAEAFRDLSVAEHLEDERAEETRREASRALAEERMRIAEDLERQGLYRAAHNEYQFAQLFVPGLAPAVEGEARTAVESRVLDLLEEVDRAVERADWDMALQRLDSAAEETLAQTEAVAQRRGVVEDARFADMYRGARDLEREFEYEDAVAAYDRLIAEVEYYDDAIRRRETLMEYIATAADLYDAAAAEADAEERVLLLRQIEIFWPTYRDVRQQLRALEGDPQR